MATGLLLAAIWGQFVGGSLPLWLALVATAVLALSIAYMAAKWSSL
ncbi:hypothetical protein [Actinokineospora sp. NPDC004072]